MRSVLAALVIATVMAGEPQAEYPRMDDNASRVFAAKFEGLITGMKSCWPGLDASARTALTSCVLLDSASRNETFGPQAKERRDTRGEIFASVMEMSGEISESYMSEKLMAQLKGEQHPMLQYILVQQRAGDVTPKHVRFIFWWILDGAHWRIGEMGCDFPDHDEQPSARPEGSVP